MTAADVILIAPLIIPLITGALTMMFWKSRTFQRVASTIGGLALAISGYVLLASVWDGGILVTEFGDWRAPFGIVVVADRLSAAMVALSGTLVLATVIYSLAAIEPEKERAAYHTLLHIMVTGVMGSFLTGDAFNLYVWFEIMLLGSFALLSLGGEKAQLDATIKYVVINILASTMLLIGTAMLYAITGSLNMADIAVRLSTFGADPLVTTIGMMFMISFGVKASLFPLYFWLPASYHTPHIAVGAVFGGLLTKVGAYVMLRYFTLFFIHDLGFTHQVLLVASVFTMFSGVLGAVSQWDWRKILAIHIISQIGYMTLGVAVFTPLAIAGAILYIGHNIIIKANLFLIAGLGHYVAGTYDLKKLGGLYKSYPALAFVFFLSALSLAGIPPLWGFWAKLVVIGATLQAKHWIAAFFALFTGVWTLFSMTKIWMYAFWKAAPEEATEPAPKKKIPLLMLLPTYGLLAMVIGIGVFGAPVFNFALEAAEEICNPDEYVRAVLSEEYLEAYGLMEPIGSRCLGVE